MTPEKLIAQYNQSLALHNQGMHYKALSLLSPLLAARPDVPKIQLLSAEILRNLGHIEEAIQVYDAAERLGLKGDEGLIRGRCSAYIDSGRPDRMPRVIGACEELLKKEMLSEEERVALLDAKMAAKFIAGDLKEAWKDFDEVGLSLGVRGHPEFIYPQWQGESLEGKSLLILSEQGIGDVFIFSTCLQEILQKTKHCGLIVDPRLAALFERSFPGLSVYPMVKRDPITFEEPVDSDFDYMVLLGSLGRYCRGDIQDFSGQGIYLKPEQSRVNDFKNHLESLSDKPKIGLSWFSLAQEYKGIELNQYLDVLKNREVTFINLQCQNQEKGLRLLRENGIDIHELPLDLYQDIDGVVALTAALDGLISPPTWNAMIGGALGVSTLMLAKTRHWKFLGRAELPWFSGVQVVGPECFHQTAERLEDWLSKKSIAGSINE